MQQRLLNYVIVKLMLVTDGFFNDAEKIMPNLEILNARQNELKEG